MTLKKFFSLTRELNRSSMGGASRYLPTYQSFHVHLRITRNLWCLPKQLLIGDFPEYGIEPEKPVAMWFPIRQFSEKKLMDIFWKKLTNAIYIWVFFVQFWAFFQKLEFPKKIRKPIAMFFFYLDYLQKKKNNVKMPLWGQFSPFLGISPK